jgi:hypothetical protein
VEPEQLPHERLVAARGLARVVARPCEKRQPRSATAVMTCSDQLRDVSPPDRVHVMVANFSHEEIVTKSHGFRSGRKNVRELSNRH